MPNQTIITGATGFIGRHVVPLLLAQNYHVTVLGRSEKKAQSFDWFSNVQFISHDISAEPLPFIPEPESRLIHLAWDALDNFKSPEHVETILPAHQAFLQNMMDAGVENILVTGTCLEYGLQEGALTTNTPTNPITAYGKAKDQLRQYLKTQDCALQWTRLFYLYGDGQSPRALIPQLDAAIERGDKTFNMSNGEQLRDYLPIQEAAKKIVALFQTSQAGSYNICSGKPISVRDLVERHIKEIGANITLNLGHYPYPDYEPMEFWGKK